VEGFSVCGFPVCGFPTNGFPMTVKGLPAKGYTANGFAMIKFCAVTGAVDSMVQIAICLMCIGSWYEHISI
jgi:hypothetical protein